MCTLKWFGGMVVWDVEILVSIMMLCLVVKLDELYVPHILYFGGLCKPNIILTMIFLVPLLAIFVVIRGRVFGELKSSNQGRVLMACKKW